MEWLFHFRDGLAHVTEGLANLSIKTVLLAVGMMLLALTLLRLATRRRNPTVAWLMENVQVVLSVVVVVFLLIRPFLFQAFYIPSSSMEPTLMGPRESLASLNPETAGDRLLVNKGIYRVSSPRRLDIAVFHAPPAASPPDEKNPEGKEFIKRVIGLPGETVEVVPPRLLLDRRRLMNLTTDSGVQGLSLADKQSPRILDQGAAAALAVGFRESELRVLARANPDVRYQPGQVEVDGKAELTDPAGRIRAEQGITEYGADSTVTATVYSIDGDPRLLVVTGRRLEYDPGHVTVNGRRLPEPYIAETPRYGMSPRRLGPDEYFMMGDNRNNSNDGHAWGPLSRWRMIGRAEVIFWPLNRAAILHWWLIGAMAAAFVGYHLFQRSLVAR